MNCSRSQVDCSNFGYDDRDAAENAPERINNVPRRKVTRRHLVQHRGKENEVLATNQRDLDVRSPSQHTIEMHRRIKTGKAATGDDYSGLFAGLHCCGCRVFLQLAGARGDFRGEICEYSRDSCRFIPQV